MVRDKRGHIEFLSIDRRAVPGLYWISTCGGIFEPQTGIK